MERQRRIKLPWTWCLKLSGCFEAKPKSPLEGPPPACQFPWENEASGGRGDIGTQPWVHATNHNSCYTLSLICVLCRGRGENQSCLIPEPQILHLF